MRWNPWKREIQETAPVNEFAQMQWSLIETMALSEGINPVDLQLAMEDRGWVKLGETLDGDTSWNTRRINTLKARIYWLLDPHATCAVRTWNNYTLGSGGVGFKAEDAGLQKQITDFMENPKNRSITSPEGQKKMDRRLLVDGEVFFAVFDTPEDGYIVRKVDCTQINLFITDPEDQETVWAYRRQYCLPDGTTETRYYRHWAYPSQDLSTAKVQDETGRESPLNLDHVEDDVLMLHVPFNTMHQRGNSLLSAALPWLSVLRQFMEDRSAITSGLAKYIRKITVKGGKTQLDRISGVMNQQLDKNPVPSMPGPNGLARGPLTREVAKSFLSNDAVSFDNMPRSTGAGDARTDFKNIRLMVAAAVGMTEPYFGDSESGNLAVATAMELPMLKQFEAHQQLWQEAWLNIFSIIANFEKPTAVAVGLNYPPIVRKDVKILVDAIVAVCAEFPELKQPEMLSYVLSTIGIDDVEDVMVRVLKTAAENEQKAADNAAKGLDADGNPIARALPQPVVTPAKGAQQKTTAPKQAVAKAVEALVASLDANTDALNEAMTLEDEDEL